MYPYTVAAQPHGCNCMFFNFHRGSVDKDIEEASEGGLKKGEKFDPFNTTTMEEEGEDVDFMSLIREADEASLDHPFFFFASFENKVSSFHNEFISVFHFSYEQKKKFL
jgi:hypothetical protein